MAILFQTSEAEARKLIAERKEDVDSLAQETLLASLPRAQAEALRAQMRKGKPQPTGESTGQPADPQPPA